VVSRRPVAIDDLLAIRMPHHPAVSPDGNRVAFAGGRFDYDANEIRSGLWVVPTAGGAPAALTEEEGRDASPKWSPDGRWIAFLSDREGKRRERKRAPLQLWIVSSTGSEPRQLTSFEAGVSQPAWSTDSRSIAFITRGTLDTPEASEPPEVIVREITRPKYKYDGMGFFDGYAHVWTVPANGGTPVQLTRGTFDHEWPLWLPGAHEVAFVTNRAPDADLTLVRDLWAANVRTGELRQITRSSGPCIAPAASPDGRWIAFVGHDFHAGPATNNGVWIVPAQGGEAVNLTAAFDRSVVNSVSSDTRVAPLFPSVEWVDGGEGIVFYATDGGHTHLYRMGVAERTIRQLTAGPEVVADFSAAGGQIVYQRMTPSSLDELWLLSPGGEPRRLVTLNAALTARLDLVQPQRFAYDGADGWPMEGWMVTPPGFDPARKYPAILRIHGGPHSSYGDLVNHYVQVLAARGFVVVWTNPRGSGGYGEAFTRAVVRDWGGKDSEDILRGLDHVIAQGFIDPARVAVTGGSYGGFMTNWLITHHDRFRCAVTEVCVSNLFNFFGTSDIGFTWGELEWGANPWDGTQILLEHSPYWYAKQVSCPVLITANEEDHRCPIEQSEQLFIALKKLGKEAVFLRFSGESHTMGSTGRPKPRIERLRHIVAWVERHLLESAERPPQVAEPAAQPAR
jgi:dipeptidyl aminopeptidase/acylaminoacyl peptidase